MIQPFLEGFDPDRRPLLFYLELWLTACRQARCSIAESSIVSCSSGDCEGTLRGIP
jgi:hypothetical protein